LNNCIILPVESESKDVEWQDKKRFSDRVLKKLFVLNFAPNGMWTYFVSVYFLKNKNEKDALNDDNFYNFLNKIIAFICDAPTIIHKGSSLLFIIMCYFFVFNFIIMIF